MNRKVLWPILLIGAALVAAPFALSLPTKATAGERMIRDFQPIMQADAVQETARYYDEVFVPLGKVAPLMGEATVAKFSGYLEGFAGVQADAARLVPLLAGALGLTPAETQDYLGRELPAFAALLQGLPQLRQDFGGLLGAPGEHPVFAQVPAGLDHYEPLVERAGERGRLPAGEQPAVVRALHLVLRRAGCPARPARGSGLWFGRGERRRCRSRARPRLRRGRSTSGAGGEALEAEREPLAVRLPGPAGGKHDGLLVEALEQLEHRPVLVLAQLSRDVDGVVGRDADEVLIEGAVMDRAKAEAVAHDRFAAFSVGDDVCCIEESDLLQAADGALLPIGGNDSPGTAWYTHVHLAHRVAPLDRIFD